MNKEDIGALVREGFHLDFLMTGQIPPIVHAIGSTKLSTPFSDTCQRETRRKPKPIYLSVKYVASQCMVHTGTIIIKMDE